MKKPAWRRWRSMSRQWLVVGGGNGAVLSIWISTRTMSGKLPVGISSVINGHGVVVHKLDGVGIRAGLWWKIYGFKAVAFSLGRNSTWFSPLILILYPTNRIKFQQADLNQRVIWISRDNIMILLYKLMSVKYFDCSHHAFQIQRT